MLSDRLNSSVNMKLPGRVTDAIVDRSSPASRLFGRLESEQGYFDTRTCPEDGFGTVIFARQKSKLGECCLQEIRDVLGRYFCRT